MNAESQDKNAKSASLRMTLTADSGYSAEVETRISAQQWGDINHIVHGTKTDSEKRRNELLEALELAIDGDGGTHYDGEDDEVGERSCCGEVSYKPHLHYCWVVKARAAIAKAKGDAS